jgi:hypothetical protein
MLSSAAGGKGVTTARAVEEGGDGERPAKARTV